MGGHDPYLDQRDRSILQSDKSLQKKIWTLVSNPGAVLYRGEVIGIWTRKKKGSGISINMTLWSSHEHDEKLRSLSEEYADFRRQKLAGVEIH